MTLKAVRWAIWGLAWLASTTTLQAQDAQWAEKMFSTLNHDFGTVAKGADTRYRVKITNKYEQQVHIRDVKTSCGCTSAKPSQDTLASLETAYIEIVMDTRKFSNQKDSAVTVVFDAPQYAEVRIPIRAYIRTDVVLTPGSIEFGSVPKGSRAERSLSITHSGRGNWAIKKVLSSNNPALNIKVIEAGRDAVQVRYDMTVDVKPDAPIGEIREQFTLVTDDPINPNIPVLIEASVEPEYVVTPGVLNFGILTPGQERTVNLVVKGQKPFSIQKIESEKTAGTFKVSLPQRPQKVHVLPLTVTAPDSAGTVEDLFTLTIDGTDQTIQFKAYGKVAGRTSAAKVPQ